MMNLKNPKISVILPVYNGEKYLAEAIESILAQTFRHFELIIVDDGSTDRSLEIIEGHSDKRIHVIRNSENLGITKSLNIGLKKGKGEYVARHDADDVSLPNRLEEQLKYLEANLEVGVVGTNVYNIREDGTVVGSSSLDLEPTFEKLLKGNRIVHGSVMMRKHVLEEHNYYNEDFGCSQDYELWLRISKGYLIKNIKNPLYKLRSHKGRLSTERFKLQAFESILAKRMAKNNSNIDLKRPTEPYSLSLNEKISYLKIIFSGYIRNLLNHF
jgi:glycosyltransferase involved in cell wall biosynthesis|tara:strand:+ start:1373 stop:2185 length:813 start_codon:yes stop_codon:yes gene_type:complete